MTDTPGQPITFREAREQALAVLAGTEQRLQEERLVEAAEMITSSNPTAEFLADCGDTWETHAKQLKRDVLTESVALIPLISSYHASRVDVLRSRLDSLAEQSVLPEEALRHAVDVLAIASDIPDLLLPFHANRVDDLKYLMEVLAGHIIVMLDAYEEAHKDNVVRVPEFWWCHYCRVKADSMHWGIWRGHMHHTHWIGTFKAAGPKL